MPTHTVVAGEDLDSIAKRYGITHWKRIYDAPENDELRTKRPDPFTLHPGDVVFVPEPAASSEGGLRTSQLHRLTVQLPRLRLFLLDVHGEARAGAKGRLTIEGQGALAVEADERGRIEVIVRGQPGSATLEVETETWELELRHLNPLEDTDDCGTSGAQARLRNLGYAVGEVDGRMGPRTRAAIRAFQADRRLEVNGRLDEPTISELNTQHRS
ncbi:MAG: peptidoglycan-binding protein [Planctomycetes bacterium]|nr:peptidoglycan-binding protein [Planctomycetota bacterium]